MDVFERVGLKTNRTSQNGHWTALKQLIKEAALTGVRCQLCAQPTLRQTALCNQCLDDLPLIKSCCAVCALPLANNATCGDCLKQQKPYIRTACTLLYQNPVNHLMHAFKQQCQWQVGKFMCDLWIQNNQTSIERAKSLKSVSLVPVPGDRVHSAKRGFIPTLFVTQYLSRATNIPIEQTLQMTGSIKSQKTLSRKQRLSNLKGVYTATKPAAKHVIVVDDVITSCATAIATSEALLKSGVISAEIWAIARTPFD